MNSKLRILHVIGGGEFGGAEQHILNLIQAFPEEEAQVAVVCFYDSVFASRLREANIEVIPLHQFGRFDLRLLQGIKEAVHTYQPDIIHTHGIKANFFTRLAVKHSVPVLVTTVHSNLRYDYHSKLAYFAVSWMERLTRHYNKHYIAISGAIGELLRQDRVAPDAISLIFNGIDLSPFRQTQLKESDRKRLLQEWNLPQDAFIFGTMARFVPVKGLHLILEAFAQLIAAEKGAIPYRLVLVGDGPERTRLEDLTAKLNLTEYVRFPGFRQDIPVVLHAFDTFVHSSLYEGMGYTIIEAMAAEVPVIATSVGGVKELVFQDQNGLLIPPNSVTELVRAMERLAADPALRARFADAALAKVEETFTIGQMARQTLELYRKLLADAAR
ncbi:glycosyltransferase [Brevibacillus fluminis]|uniref:Glycosyltransferase n=1 Tax=Brevibacillus fluminis TaxID=511487 RepID=A0A3M8DS94_9BACL|nr:glycosyltransferase [Brevibacillus fluminis]RNB90359.1 glycosyltransferase [Brevibacillus fluminis]